MGCYKRNACCLLQTEFRRDQEEGCELDSHKEVRRFCGSRRDQEEGGGAGPAREPRIIMSREVELGLKVGLLLHQLFPNSGASDIVFVTVPHSSWDGNCMVQQLLGSGEVSK